MAGGNGAMKRNLFGSTVAVLVGFVSIAVLGFLTDSALQWAGILPVPSEVKFDDKHALLALAYHLVYGLLGSYVTARLAPSRPMAHALALGVLGVFISTLGLIAIVTEDLAPACCTATTSSTEKNSSKRPSSEMRCTRTVRAAWSKR